MDEGVFFCRPFFSKRKSLRHFGSQTAHSDITLLVFMDHVRQTTIEALPKLKGWNLNTYSLYLF